MKHLILTKFKKHLELRRKMENQKLRIQKRKFRIGNLSKALKVKKFVIRFWEKEFGLESDRSEGGQRFYTQDDFEKFSTIKDLLYNKKFTIPGAKVQLESQQKKRTTNPITPAQKTETEPKENKNTSEAFNVIEYKTVEKISEETFNVVEKIIEKPVPQIPKNFFEKLSHIKSKLQTIKELL